MQIPEKFIIVDDDYISNFICKKLIIRVTKNTNITEFISSEKAFEYILTEYAVSGKNASTALFLDINMPVMDGWEFLEKFEKLNEKIKKSFTIYIISSSVNPIDKEVASCNSLVSGYIVKPLTEDFLEPFLR